MTGHCLVLHSQPITPRLSLEWDTDVEVFSVEVSPWRKLLQHYSIPGSELLEHEVPL
jgi:hypothetical protein